MSPFADVPVPRSTFTRQQYTCVCGFIINKIILLVYHKYWYIKEYYPLFTKVKRSNFFIFLLTACLLFLGYFMLNRGFISKYIFI